MNIHAEKIELARLLLATNDKSILAKIKNLLKKEDNDWWDEISPAERGAIEKAMQAAKRGETITHEEAVQKFGKWGLK
ncbi:hypothetical protein [Chitinophaga sp. YIM B06452]|uniref:hypothetical protein n=1 Tax=Chitinophaga sp. YIM B06452 TaxID=3082158 RepID=UPI0031FE8251